MSLDLTNTMSHGKPLTHLGMQLSHEMNPPVFAPAPPPQHQECTASSDCRGDNIGCCLKGRCSQTGGMFDPCFTQEPQNGKHRYQGVWARSDLCPCLHRYHCLDINSGDSHPQHGPRGFCMPAIGWFILQKLSCTRSRLELDPLPPFCF